MNKNNILKTKHPNILEYKSKKIYFKNKKKKNKLL